MKFGDGGERRYLLGKIAGNTASPSLHIYLCLRSSVEEPLLTNAILRQIFWVGVFSHSVMSSSLRRQGLEPTRLLYP